MLISLLNDKLKIESTLISERHNKKLLTLWHRQRKKSPDAITNLSSLKLNIYQQQALRFGLNHHICPPKVDHLGFKVRLENLFM